MKARGISAALRRKLEDENITIATSHRQGDEWLYEVEFYSPAGGDEIATIYTELDYYADDADLHFAQAMRDYAHDYDPDEEAALWIGEDGHGKNGAPYRLRDLIADREAVKKKLEAIAETAFAHYNDPKRRCA